MNSLPLKSIANAVEIGNKIIWSGDFFDNHKFEGTPIEEEFDSIDFVWGKESPIPDKDASLFSAILRTTVISDKGATAQLKGAVSGELELYLNGEKIYVVDEGAESSFNKEVTLEQGTNEFEVKYKSNPEAAKLKLDLLQDNDAEELSEEISEELPTDNWLASYYETLDLTGEKKEELVANLNFTDLDSFTKKLSLNESFSSSYEKAFIVSEESKYVISGTVQGGVKVYVDEELIIEEWTNGLIEIKREFKLNEGTHHIRIEYKNDHEKIPSIAINVDVLEQLSDEIEEPEVDSGESSEESEEPEVDSGESSEESEEPEVDSEESSEESEEPAIDSQESNEESEDMGVETEESPSDNEESSYDTQEATSNFSLFSAARTSMDKWTAEFYANTSFSGTPIVATYETLNLFWGVGSPHPSIPNDKFSAVFKKQLTVDESSFYRISGRADDGIRVYVDNKLVINHWENGVNRYKEDLLLTKGTHDIRVEYYDNLYSAAISVEIMPIKEIIDENWEATYYPTANFTGNPVVKKLNKLDLNWGSGSPDSKIPNDNFTATFHKKLIVTTDSDFLFEGRADDGIRIYVDDKLIIDQWKEGVNLYSTKVNLSPGEYLVRVEYFEKRYGAALNLNITDLPIITDGWTATYYPTKSFTGKPVTRVVQNLDLNWGSGSPAAGIPSDNFSAIFEKRLVVQNAGTYHVSGRADDGIRIYVDGKLVINSWGNGVNILNHYIELSAGTHTIKVEYYDEKYSAAIKVDIEEASIPNDSWLATYYPTKSFTGLPVTRVEQKLDLNWGAGSPATGIPSDNFTAIFEKQLVVQKAGTYHISGRADDGIRVYIDGKLVINSWKNGVNMLNHLVELSAGTHTIKVEYYEEKYGAAIKVDIEEASMPKDSWLATYYPTKSFTGLPVKRYEQKLDLNWGGASPDSSIPIDNFTATFEKEIQITESGTYLFSGRADDGIRIYVNGRIELDSWNQGVNTFSKNVDLAVGKHEVKVEYFEEKYGAAIKLDVSKAIKQTIYKQTSYMSTFNDALAKQMKSQPQTDKKYPAYITKPALVVGDDSASGIVQGGPWNVRGVPGLESPTWVLGQLTSGNKVGILGEVLDSKGGSWYNINYLKAWVNANSTDVAYYMNPANFKANTKEYYQFLSLKGSGAISIKEVNDKILLGKGILHGKASSFSDASKTHSINEVYLISHALLETGNGTSELATGVLVESVDGEPVVPKIVYNTYGIGAIDKCPVQCGSEYAYKQNWTSPEAAIVGGAAFISKNYIHAGQDTLYKMRWNPAAPATHQYATDIGWAVKQTNRMYEFYSLLDTYTLTFDVPEYRK